MSEYQTRTLDEVKRGKYKNDPCWTPIWEACTSPVFLVVDEEGCNVAYCQIRHFERQFWLLVDDIDGYQIMHEDDVHSLILVEIDEN